MANRGSVVEARALDWLLEESNPSVRLFTLTDVLGVKEADSRVRSARESLMEGGPVARLMRAQHGRGYWAPNNTTYEPKFTSTVWQLMLLGELGAKRVPWIDSAVERFLAQHQMENGAFCCSAIGSRGKLEEEPCLTGNMIRALLVLGFEDDARVRRAIEWLPEHQFEDGGWNCDYPSYKPTHGSFMSTVEPLWAYSEVPKAKWTKAMRESARKGAEFLLSHRVYKSHRTREPVELRGIKRVFNGTLVTMFHFPMYYYYDALHGLRVLCRLGYQGDDRLDDAIHLMLSKVTSDGRWLLDGDWVRERSDSERRTLVELEAIGQPSKWVTLNCYRVLSKRGELETRP